MKLWKLQVKLNGYYGGPSYKTKGIYPFYWMALVHQYLYHIRHSRRILRIV